MIKRVQNFLFYTLVFLLPINLGKHFIVADSYVKTYLIDYMVPTIWLTDLLLVALLFVWFFNKEKNIRGKYPKFLLLFVSSLLPSLALSTRLIPSMYAFAVLVLHVLFALILASSFDVQKNFRRVVGILSVSVILLSVLGVFQWFGQGSVFDNYLFFGEQPYSASVKGIARVSMFGKVKVPVYGLFRHPNVFAGFLAISLFWIYTQLSLGYKSLLFKIAFTLGFFILLFTFSEVAMFSLFSGLLFFQLIKRFGKKGVLLSLLFTFGVFFIALLLPVFSRWGSAFDDPSLYRRANLQKSSYMMLDDNALFGVGLNNFTAKVEDYLPKSQVLRFIQPTHNIFVLLFSEVGLFGFVSFLLLFMFVLFSLLSQSFGIPAILFITLLQFVLLGSFDHYLLTIHQMQLLFWLTVGFALTYTKEDVEV
ncbi:O-antigen ligase family protein [candidate division WWE3 bacterium]|jgi:O-antigen ligase|nr:O-antigen ligase family protein [candidate division WWE3 bacterium]MBT7350293.1 O-antigen ligase family protein [candidate division WWE3 bacterium]